MDDMKDLKTRKIIAQSLIQTIEGFEQDDRTRAKINEYKAQLAVIEQRIKDLENTKDVVIGLKPASLTARKQ